MIKVLKHQTKKTNNRSLCYVSSRHTCVLMLTVTAGCVKAVVCWCDGGGASSLLSRASFKWRAGDLFLGILLHTCWSVPQGDSEPQEDSVSWWAGWRPALQLAAISVTVCVWLKGKIVKRSVEDSKNCKNVVHLPDYLFIFLSDKEVRLQQILNVDFEMNVYRPEGNIFVLERLRRHHSQR